ncbi:hypothetical protein [Mucilaginibacter sp. UYCu711]|uniref:hypothetical protein n=1 Tax=Mucilaginibacter sp. UYCu711 TaxID=3156339 RepID=UPI003D1B7EFC
MKDKLLSIILLLTPLALFSQNATNKNDVIVHISFDDTWGRTRFLEVSKKSKNVIISSITWASMDKEGLQKDTGFVNLKKNRSEYSVIKLNAYYDQYSKFDTTTVTIDLKTDHQYDGMLKLLATASKVKLEKNHEKRDLVMDTGDCTFTITNNNNTKKVYAQGLFEQRYPILTNFIDLTYARLEPIKQK